MSVNNTNPGTYLTGTTSVAWGSGRVPVSVDSSDTAFNSVEKTGGAKTHILTTDEMPSHNHIAGDNNKNHRHGLFTTYGDCVDASHGLMFHDGEIDYVNTIAAGWISSSDEYNKGRGYYEHIWNNNSEDNSYRYNMATENSTHSHDLDDTGSGNSHNNIQPSITCYMWKRTA